MKTPVVSRFVRSVVLILAVLAFLSNARADVAPPIEPPGSNLQPGEERTRLPYEASPQNVIMDLPIGWAETTPGGVFQGNEVRWHFDKFEPGENQPVQNMEFALVAPPAWQSVLTARANVERSPNDGEAWGIPACSRDRPEPVCGSAAFLPLMVMFWLVWKRK